MQCSLIGALANLALGGSPSPSPSPVVATTAPTIEVVVQDWFEVLSPGGPILLLPPPSSQATGGGVLWAVAPGPWSPDIYNATSNTTSSGRRQLQQGGGGQQEIGTPYAVVFDNSTASVSIEEDGTTTVRSLGSVYVAFGRQLPFSLRICTRSLGSPSSSSSSGGTANATLVALSLAAGCGVWGLDGAGLDVTSDIDSLDQSLQGLISPAANANATAGGATLLSFTCTTSIAELGRCMPGSYNLT